MKGVIECVGFNVPLDTQ